ncbi:MAG: tetratricopeptide repeat protein, partial [Roseimicrobium sp.]
MQKQTRHLMFVTCWPLCAMALVAFGMAASASAQTLPRAVPVAEPVGDLPRPVRAVPVEPTPAKAQPVADPNRASGPDEDLYDYAMLCWSQNDYSIALKPFADYVRTYPQGRHAAEAWFRLGECHRMTNAPDDAKRAYNELITRYPRSESAASAAYRLGSMAYSAKEFVRGITYFEIAERGSTSADVKIAATFNKGLCYKYAGQSEKALTAFKVVSKSSNEAMVREIEVAQQESAALAMELGRKEEALAAFTQIIATAKDRKVLGEALLRFGLLLNELGRADEAMKSFRRALEIRELPSSQRGIAIFGLIQGYFVKGDYDAVIQTYTANAGVLPPEDVRAKALLIVGTAYKNKQLYRQAVEVFLLLEKQHPDASEAIDAGYQKLLCFLQLGDKDLPLFAERFEQRYHDKFPDHDYLHMSRLVRADWWFTKAGAQPEPQAAKDGYTKATEAFSEVDLKRVPEKVRASVIYKKGFAESEAAKANEAISTLTLFLTDYPGDANVPVALAQRGVSYKATRAFDKALADFASIIKAHGSHPAAEMALYQSGLIKLELRDTQGLITDMEQLVAKFPASAAAAEAWYRIGRGYIELQQKPLYAKAIEPLHKAIALDPKTWLDKASQLLISCQYLREDVDGLAK